MCSCPAAASRCAVPKQLSVPRWQTAPVGCARIKSVSPSQSAAMACTSRKCPEVSPLVQSLCLLRLKKVTRPLARVAASASRVM
jgi:hypothetical protein